MIASKISGFSKEYPTAYPVGYRTYARKSSNSEPRESGEQVKQRALDGLFKLGRFTKEEQEKITQYLDKNQSFPSGRYLWCGGLEFSEKQPNYYSLYNCSNITIETWADLAHNFNFLMQGNGSGAKLEYKNVNKLPAITSSISLEVVGSFGGKKPGQETTTVLYTPEKVVIAVGDSRLGWCDAYQELLELSSNHESSSWNVVIDVSNVREKGSIIKGFGGKTNPVGLIPLFNRVVEITNKAVGRQLTPLEVSFLANEAALCTVAGNIRRSARLDQFSKEDLESGIAKMNLWTQTPDGNWVKDKSKDALRMANFTRVWHQKPSQNEIKQALTTQFQCAEGAIQFAPEAVARANADLLDNEEKKNKFIELYCEDQNQAANYLVELWNTYPTAEIFPLDDRELEHRMSRYGLNPCFVAGTMILTKEGSFPIESLLGKVTEVWDGSSWQETEFKVTGKNQPVLTITLQGGDSVTATPYHTFILLGGNRVEAKDLEIGLTLKSWMVDANIADFQIADIKEAGIADEVYCCTVESNHSLALSNGLLTGQCGEIIGNNFFCVAGNTPIITKDGISDIQELVGTEVEVWNGESWSFVVPFETGRDRKLYRVYLSDGSFVDCTGNHKWYVKNRFQREFVQMTTEELRDYKGNYQLYTEPFSIQHKSGISVSLLEAYTAGFAFGDGTYDKSRDIVCIPLYGKKQEVEISGAIVGEYQNEYGTSYLLANWKDPFDIIKDRSIESLRKVSTWDKKAILNFVAGLADSDGSETGTGGIRIYLTGYERAQMVYLLLLQCGIRSSINLMAEKGSTTNFGSRGDDLWYLQVTDCASLPCQRLNVDGGHAPTGKGKNQLVKRVEELPGTHTTYCVNEPVHHKVVFNGSLTGNCNLVEVHLNQLTGTTLHYQEEVFYHAGLQCAALLSHEFDIEKFRYSREVDPIVGVSFTGLFDFFVNHFGSDWLLWWEEGRPENWYRSKNNTCVNMGAIFKEEEALILSRWREAAEQGVKAYCEREGLRVPNRCTTVQPAGTKSLLTGASPGWHPPKAPRFLRRITFAKNDAVARACIDYGYRVTPSQSDTDEEGNLLTDPFDPRCTEWLVEIPVEADWATLSGADTVDTSKFSVRAQFDFYMQVQTYYTTHNTSATIEYREEEIEEFSDILYTAIQEDRGYISAAMMARFDVNETMPRLPFEPISKEVYEEEMAGVLERRKSDDFYSLLMQYDMEVEDFAGPSGCDGDKCLMPEAK